MSWQFMLEVGNQSDIKKRLEKCLKEEWKLKKESQNELWNYYQKEGLTVDFWDVLTTRLCFELNLDHCAVLEQVGFEELFYINSKKGNAGMTGFFSHWNSHFGKKKGAKVIQKNASAFLEKKDLLELVYWLEICSTILSEKEIWLINPEAAEDQFLLKEAIAYCNINYEEHRSFGYQEHNFVYLKEKMENSPFDFFYWYNSF